MFLKVINDNDKVKFSKERSLQIEQEYDLLQKWIGELRPIDKDTMNCLLQIAIKNYKSLRTVPSSPLEYQYLGNVILLSYHDNREDEHGNPVYGLCNRKGVYRGTCSWPLDVKKVEDILLSNDETHVLSKSKDNYYKQNIISGKLEKIPIFSTKE
jgi:hypothetical protein